MLIWIVFLYFLVVLLLSWACIFRRQRQPGPRVTVLPERENLAVPAPLPAPAFTAPEVELVRPHLGGACRDWNRLDPGLRQRLLVAFRIMRERYGYDLALLEGYRSPARQTELAALGGSVTNARGWQRYHEVGLAADCGFWRDGKLVISERDPWALRGYRLYGAVAEALGLSWGGRWNMMDLGHIELRSHHPVARFASAQANSS